MRLRTVVFAASLLCALPELAQARVAAPRLLDDALTSPVPYAQDLFATADDGSASGAAEETVNVILGAVFTYGCGLGGLMMIPSAIVFGVLAFGLNGLAGSGMMWGFFIASAVVAVLCIIGFVIGLNMVVKNAPAVISSEAETTVTTASIRPRGVEVSPLAQALRGWELARF